MTPGCLQTTMCSCPQTPENRSVILTEMVHDARIVPMDGRPFLNIPQWKGESRGPLGTAIRWSSKRRTFKRETSLAGIGAPALT